MNLESYKGTLDFVALFTNIGVNSLMMKITVFIIINSYFG